MNALPISRKFYYGSLAAITLFVSPLALKIQHHGYKNNSPRPERTIIVTGATGTLGHATTKQLSQRKCRVIMACRDMDKCKAIRREIVLLTKNSSVVCRHLDLEDIESINKFADDIMTTEPHIDVLINMAAVKELKKRELTKYGIEKHFFVNFLAPYLLTLKLMPKLEDSARETRDSRVINVIGNPKKSWHIDLNDINFEKRKYKNQAAHNQSKLALAYFSILLEKYNRAKKNMVYVFGTSPSVKNILPMNDFSTKWIDDIKREKAAFLGFNAEAVCQRNIICALDKSLVKDNLSGRNYNYIHSAMGWNHGWNVAAANEDKAKLTWNLAAELLMNAKPIIADDKSSDKPSPMEPKNGQRPLDLKETSIAQVKAQGNNKASGVLESA